MKNGREFRTVVHRKFVYSVRLFGLRVSLGIGPPNEPEDRWYVPFGSEGPEILAGGSRPGFPNALCSEMSAKCVHHAFGGILIVHVEGILIDRRNFRRPRRARSGCLGVGNTLDRSQDALAHARIESTDIQLDDSLVRNDVF